MSGIRERLEGQPGYEEYQDTALRQRKKGKYPWGMLAANVAGISGAHFAGYMAGGALVNALMKSPRIGPRLAKMNPDKRARFAGHLIGIFGSAGTVAASLSHMAGQQRIAEELSRLETQERLRGHEKAASVYGIYAAALGAEL
jgi:hypothetical protein